MHARVLLVDADSGVREWISAALSREGYGVVSAPPGPEVAGRLAKDGPFDVVVTDLSTCEGGGIELLEAVRGASSETEVVVLAEDAAAAAAMQALRLGAADYVRKPLGEHDVGLAVRRCLLTRRLMRENEALRAAIRAFESARSLGSCLETADVLPLALDMLSEALDRDRAVARLVEVDGPIEGVYLRGFGDAEGAELRGRIERDKLFDPHELERPSARGSESLHNGLDRLGLDSGDLLALPLRVDGRLVGGIWLFAGERSFETEEVRRAEIVVRQAELALLNAQRFVQATEKAFVDDVTDLYNSRYLLAAVDREIERADRGRLELSVLFLDLDRFKLVNDRYGHLVGSSVLRELGGVLRECSRTIDTVGRYGGDEFTILLVDTGLEGAQQVAERIRSAVAGRPFGADRGLRLQLTLSVGVATFPFHGRSREQVLDMADKAMYLAKALGRDRVCTADELTISP